ncbi:unnamed protein product [Leuciscus chuanchicus]
MRFLGRDRQSKEKIDFSEVYMEKWQRCMGRTYNSERKNLFTFSCHLSTRRDVECVLLMLCCSARHIVVGDRMPLDTDLRSASLSQAQTAPHAFVVGWVLAFEIFIPLVLFFILLGLRQKKPAIPVKEAPWGLVAEQATLDEDTNSTGHTPQ